MLVSWSKLRPGRGMYPDSRESYSSFENMLWEEVAPRSGNGWRSISANEVPILDLNDLAAELVRVYRCNTETSREARASTETLNPCLGELSKISKRNMIMRIDVLFPPWSLPFIRLPPLFPFFIILIKSHFFLVHFIKYKWPFRNPFLLTALASIFFFSTLNCLDQKVS